MVRLCRGDVLPDTAAILGAIDAVFAECDR